MIELPGHSPIIAPPGFLRERPSITINDGPGTIIVYGNELLPVKLAERRLENGDGSYGVLLFSTEQLSFDQIVIGTKLTVIFSDVAKRTYRVPVKVTEATVSRRPLAHILPGLRSGPTTKAPSDASNGQ
jgi:hypothetical protein